MKRFVASVCVFFAMLLLSVPTSTFLGFESGFSSLVTEAEAAGQDKGAGFKRRRRRRRNSRRYRGRLAKESELRTEPLPESSGEVWIYAVNFKTEYKVELYKEERKTDIGALSELDEGFRCKRTNEVRSIDPRLYELLSLIYDHFGKRRIQLVSGFRNQRNEGSRHYHGAAMDIRIPGVPLRKLHRYVKSLDTGGLGIGLYPTSRFVHLDIRAPGERSYRWVCLLYTSPSPRDQRGSRMPSSA